MEISFLGHASFRLKGKTATVVTDPYNEMVGKYPKDVTADIVTISHQHPDHNAMDKIQTLPAGRQESGDPVFKIEYPGEYEIKGVSVIGVQTFHDAKNGEERGKNTIFVIEIDGLRIAHLGDLGDKLTAEQLEAMGPVDIVMVPVGGFYTIDAATAMAVVKQIDPWVAIPMHFQDEGLDKNTFEKLTPVEDFFKAFGKTDITPMAKYVVSAEKLPTEFNIVWLTRK